MTKNYTGHPYKPLDRESDEFLDLCDNLILVLKEHFSSCVGFVARSDAGLFFDTFDDVMLDFWTREKATIGLDKLKQAILALSVAYEKVPPLVLRELVKNARPFDERIKQKFFEETTSGVFSSSLVPKPGAAMATDALSALCNHRLELLAVIEKTRKDLPVGIKTQNRPLKEWALIEAAVELVRHYNAMNIPDDMESSGDLYRLLRDVFAVFGIEKYNFKGVYGGWLKHMDGNHEKFDLITI